jgi:hypothetical protein
MEKTSANQRSTDGATTKLSGLHVGIALTILLLAAGLRLYATLQAHLWLDEFWMLEVANGHDTLHERIPTNVLMTNPPALTSLLQARPWWTIWTTLSEVPHPPLFYILVRWWRQIVGPTEMAARLLPWLASVASVWLMYRLVLLLHGPCPALGAMLLIALGPQQIYFAQELRPYSFLLAMGIAACYLVIRIEQDGPGIGRLLALGFVTLILLLTHYFSAGSLLALAAYAVIRLPRKNLWRVAAAFVIPAIIFAIAWGPFLLRQHQMQSRQASSLSFLADPGAGHIHRAIVRLATIPAQALCLNTLSNHPPAWLIVIVLIGFLTPLIWLGRNRALLLWYLWFAGTLLPLAAGDLLNHFRTLGIPRYTVCAEIAVYGVIAAVASLGGGKIARPSTSFAKKLLATSAAPLTAAVVAAVSLPAALAEAAAKPDWQPMIEELRRDAAEGQPIIYAAENRAGSIVYLFASHYLDPSEHHPALILTGPLTADLRRRLQPAGGQWLVFSGRGQTLQALLPGSSFEMIAGVKDHDGFMGGVVVRIVWSKVDAKR